MKQNLRWATEAVPIVGALNVLHRCLGQVLNDALSTKDIRTTRAAVNLSALTTPPAIQLTAILAFFKLTRVVEPVTAAALGQSKYWMHSNFHFSRRRRSNVIITDRTVHSSIGHHVDDRKGFHEEFFFRLRGVILKFEQKACENCQRFEYPAFLHFALVCVSQRCSAHEE